MNKSLIITLSVIGGVIVLIVALIATIALVTINNNKKNEEAYLRELRSTASVRSAFYEMQHPGVPWNNDFVTFVVMDIDNEAQVSNTLQSIKKANATYMSQATSHSIYVINADEVSSSRYNERSLYFKDIYLGDNTDKMIFKNAARAVGMETFENSAKY